MFSKKMFVLSLSIASIFFTSACSQNTSAKNCSDGMKNQNETDVDCGGICPTCENSKGCLVDSDCTSGHCETGKCESYASETCTDNKKNQDETDIDCGGSSCDSCSNGKGCLRYTDCKSGFCENGVCTTATQDQCPDDPDKTEPGQCGCGLVDTDTDSDGTADCNDQCPDDPDKTEPDQCGCGLVDTDTDSDGTADCNDQCPDDPDKTEPDQCGCGVADTDDNNNGSADCIEDCSGEPNGVAEIDNCGRCTGGNTGVEPCTVLVLEPEADAYVLSAYPDSNYGTDDELKVLRNNTARTYLRFNLSQLPPGAFIYSATLKATSFCGFAWDGDGKVYTRFVADDSWEENAITWNTMPTADEENHLGYWLIWYDSNCSDAPKIGTNTSPSLKHAIQAEADGDNLISLRLDSPGYDTEYYSREHSEAEERPTLEIAYIEPKIMVIEPNADAYVSNSQPDENFGLQDEIKVERNDFMSFLRFDVSSIPQNADVRAVSLRAVSFNGHAWGGDGNVYTRFVQDDSWDESAITWNNMPEADEENHLGYWWIWYNHGANAPKVGVNSDPALANMVTGEALGDGLISLRLDSPGYWTSYYSREHSDEQDRPQLIVYYFDTQSVELDPVADSYVLSGSPDENYGTNDNLEILHNLASKIFLRFDLNDVIMPPNSLLARISLKAVSFDGHAWGGDGNVYTRFVQDDSWDENAITWNNMPEADEENHLGYWWIWYNHGANAPKVGINSDPKLMDSVVEQMAEDGIVSFMLSSTGYDTSYYSREHEEPQDRPKLIYTFYLP